MHSKCWNYVAVSGQVPALDPASPKERGRSVLCLSAWLGPEVIVDVVAKQNVFASASN